MSAVLDDQRLTFADTVEHVGSVAAALRDRYGVTRGDRVAILAANSPSWVITFFATVSLGAIVAGFLGAADMDYDACEDRLIFSQVIVVRAFDLATGTSVEFAR